MSPKAYKKSKISKNLVIDASIAHSAGQKEHPSSKHCRELLDSILAICHKMVMTKDIRDEWNNHQSIYAKEWRYTMTSRGKIISPASSSNNILLDKLQNSAEELYKQLDERKSQLEIMRKDLHLIEASLETHSIIISTDKEAQKAFTKISHDIGEIKQIMWINPVANAEEMAKWLEEGAKTENKYFLENISDP